MEPCHIGPFTIRQYNLLLLQCRPHHLLLQINNLPRGTIHAGNSNHMFYFKVKFSGEITRNGLRKVGTCFGLDLDQGGSLLGQWEVTANGRATTVRMVFPIQYVDSLFLFLVLSLIYAEPIHNGCYPYQRQRSGSVKANLLPTRGRDRHGLFDGTSRFSPKEPLCPYL